MIGCGFSIRSNKPQIFADERGSISALIGGIRGKTDETIMTTTLKLWFRTIATTFARFGALLVFAAIYAFLLLASYIFIAIREATVLQVLVTYTLMILIPLGFFVFQASIIDREVDQRLRWRVILIDAVKFLLVTIPVLLIVWLLYYLLNKVAGRYPAPVIAVAQATQAAARPAAPTSPVTPPLHWPSLIFTTLRFALLGVAFPLVTIRLWIALASSRFKLEGSFVKQVLSAVASAFSADSVLIYALGLIIFFVLPYVVLVPTFKITGNKAEFIVFGLRLLLAFLFSLVGWVITLTALTRTVPNLPAEVSEPVIAEPAEAAA